MSTSSATTTPPTQASWLRENVRQNSWISPRARGGIASPPHAAADPDARVHQPVGDVGQEVGNEREGGHDDQVPHDHRVVAGEDRLHHQLAHSRNGEDPFDDDAAPDQPRQRQAQDRHHREERVPERVLADHDLLRKPLGARRLDVLLPDHFEHALPHVAREPREPAERGHRDRQDQVGPEVPLLLPEGQGLPVEVAEAGDGQPAELDTEQDLQQDGEPEVRGGEAHEDGHGGDLVEDRVLAGRREDPDRHRQRQNDQHLDDVQEEGDGQALADLLEDRLAVGGGGAAKVEHGDPLQPVPVLDVERLVQAEFRLERLDDLGIYLAEVRVDKEIKRPARGELDHEKRDEGDTDQEREGQREPSERVEEHLAGGVPLPLFRDVPLDEVEDDPVRRRLAPRHAP